jgi:membrane-bound lytic murein transglycosylase A
LIEPPPARPPRRRRGDPWRTAALAAAGVAAAALAIALWALGEIGRGPSAIEVRAPAPAPAEPLPDQRTLARASFEQLGGWPGPGAARALDAFRASCADGTADGGGDLGPLAASALAVACAGALAVEPGDDAAARAYFESVFEPWRLANRGEAEGLLTGYYEPELAGDRRRRGPYRHPLYLDPGDRQVVDLGAFRKDLAGRKITGLVRGGRFRPYWDRAEIEAGSLAGRGLEMLWVADPVALFFLQIQGSGRVRLPDGSIVRVGYAAQNGHDYTPIGRVLIERGALVREEVSMQSIRAWLAAHPEEAGALMDENRSYVFFRVLPGDAPVGAEGVELTAGHSIAVDPRFLPYGLPVWLESTLPAAPEIGRGAEVPLARLTVAQDTGGAIRGPVRADLFLGPGVEAEATAGRMKQPLAAWLLWPRGAPAPPATSPPAAPR